MDTAYGLTASAVTDAPFVGSVRRYSLFQAITLTVEWLRLHNPGIDAQEAYELILFRANPSLGFPACDVQEIEFEKQGNELRATLWLNLLSLSGSSSPLPSHYVEVMACDDAQGGNACELFDLFHHRLHRLLYPLWLKYRYYAGFDLEARDEFSQRMFAMIGLGSEALRADSRLNWKRLLPYLGLLSLRVHSAGLIEAVLRYYFQHADIYIEQCLVRSVVIPDFQHCLLGAQNNQLGSETILGERIRDRSSKFRIFIINLEWDQFHCFLPISQEYQLLCELVRFTLRDPLDYDICLGMKPEVYRPLSLSHDNSCRLGWTSWLGAKRCDRLITISGS